MEYDPPFSRPEMEPTQWVHIPTPGDHYSPATGSAVITVIAGLAKAQFQHGAGIPKVLVTRGATHGYPPYPFGEVIESPARSQYPSALQRMTDVLFGRMAGFRPFTNRLYKKLAEPLPRNFSGVLIIHNQPGAVVPLRGMYPECTLVLHLHNASFANYSDSEVAKIAAAMDKMICCSSFLAELSLQRIPRPHAHKVHAVLNGVDTEQFRPVLKRHENDAFPLTILFMGRMLPEKGPDLLIKAALLLHKKRRQGGLPAFRIRMIGSHNFNASAPLSRYERSLRNLAYPLGKIIEFRPFYKRDKVPKIYQDADVFVAPSNWDEPFGLTIAEAMASGLPCIVSKRGGIPEVAHEAALYFSPPNVENLADRLEQLLTYPALRTELAQKSRCRSLELDWTSRFGQVRNALFRPLESPPKHTLLPM